MNPCTCQTVSNEYSDHRHECPIYVAGRSARIAAKREMLSYALAKQVPDISTHATFETNYGQLRLDYEDSQKVAALVEKLLRKQLKSSS